MSLVQLYEWLELLWMTIRTITKILMWICSWQGHQVITSIVWMIMLIYWHHIINPIIWMIKIIVNDDNNGYIIVDVKMSIVVYPTPKTISCHVTWTNSTTSNTNHLVLNALHH